MADNQNKNTSMWGASNVTGKSGTYHTTYGIDVHKPNGVAPQHIWRIFPTRSGA